MRNEVRVNVYAVVLRAVEEGTQRGITRAFKHDDAPDAAAIADHVEREIMSALCDIIEFEEP